MLSTQHFFQAKNLLRCLQPSLQAFSKRFQTGFSSRSEASRTHYELLGVARTASVSEIKSAFRQKARLAHPDAVGSGNTPALNFAEVLVAYQVLTNARERQLYNLSIDTRTGRLARDAASSEPVDRSSRQPPAAFRVLKEGTWVAWAATAPAPRTGSQVDRIRAELSAEFRSALRHAYLGPELDLEEGQLPECFEAEERSDPAAADVLQLVSGRRVLGVVRQQNTEQLQEPQGGRIARHQQALFSHGAWHGGAGCSEQGSPHAGPAEPLSPGSEADEQPQVQRTVLQLVMEGEVRAVGLREQLQGDRRARITVFDRSGRRLSVEEDGQLWKVTVAGQQGTDSSRGALGRRKEAPTRPQHGVLRGSTPLVRHLQFVGHQGGEQVNVCRCRCAWLPPSSLWLFPPRSEQHSSRSWYFEWPGYQAAHHPLWLHPAVFVLTCAFDSLDREHSAVHEPLTHGPKSWLHRAGKWARLRLGLTD